MELNFLHYLQSIRTDFWDQVLVFFTGLGDKGWFFIIIGLILLCVKKTRKVGITILLSLLLSLLVCNGILKNWVQRTRPFANFDTMQLLVKTPQDFSFPSGHTSAAFACAISIFLYNKKAGGGMIAFALIIAFSRMYLFVHYPTDVLIGAIVGSGVAVVSYLIINKISKKMEMNKAT